MGGMLVNTCPHCLTHSVSMAIIHAESHYADRCFNVLLECRRCRRPACAVLSPDIEPDFQALRPEFQSKTMHEMLFGQIWSKGFPEDGDVRQRNWKVDHLWPEVPKPRLPDGLPPEVVRAFLAAEHTFPTAGLEEASAGSYRRALDVGTKLIAQRMPNAADFEKKKLNDRIDMLRKHGRLTEDLAAWAHQVKGVGNEAMHELDAVTREELTALRGFTEMVLTYLFTLPGMLAARRADADKAKG